MHSIQLFQLRLSPEQSGKVEYERERLLGIANKLMNLLAIPSNLSRSYSSFTLCSWTTLIEIAVCVENTVEIYSDLFKSFHVSDQPITIHFPVN